MEENTPFSHENLRFQMLDFEVSKSMSNTLVENYFFLKNYVTSEGAISHNILYYQQLSIDC